MSTSADDKPKVLLVEDNPTNRKILGGILGKLDCNVIEAETGAQALEAITDNDFAIILLDVQLPDMDGFHIAEVLSQDSRKRETPMMFVSATFTDDLSRLNGYKLGAVDYITKPVDPFIFKSKVQVFIDLHHSKMRQMQLRRLLQNRNEELEKEIEERQRAEERALHQATHDALTDLPNRILFMDRLHTAISRAHREDALMGLIYIDIDHFKPVNDNHGHPAGDVLLKLIAQRLRSVLRESDTVARLGGDEFAVVLERINARQDAEAVMDKIKTTLQQTFTLHIDATGKDIDVNIDGSLGLAIYPEDGEEEEALLHQADALMYEEKKRQKKAG